MPAYSFKKRFVTPIRIGLGLPVRHEDADSEAATILLPKRHTIRAVGQRRHARPGETVQLYCGMRTKQCFKIGEGRCTQVRPISIQVMANEITKIEIEGARLFGTLLQEFARADGFADAQDMRLFWIREHGKRKRTPVINFEGLLIEWEPINGGK